MGLISSADFVSLINATPTKAVVIATGGGAEVFSLLLGRGGGSATLLAGLIPYSSKETELILGRVPEKMVSTENTRTLAMAAYQKALKLKDGDYDVIGVSCTASLQRTPDERKGRVHQIHVALQTKDTTHSASLIIEDALLVTGEVTPINIREAEETICAQMILNELAMGCGVKERIQVWVAHEDLIVYDKETSLPLSSVLASNPEDKVYFLANSPHPRELDDRNKTNIAVFPGSFNPMHEGHVEMMQYINDEKNLQCFPEISLFNVDKPALDFISVRDRLKQIGRPTLITNAPTFVDKSRLFIGARFIIGQDTYDRILNPKYAGSIDHVCSMFEGNRNYFYIFPRNGEPKGFWSADKASPLRGEFILTKLKYRHVSSTAIRKDKNG